uniref:Uncharacterized protein n=1 Tax=Chromera velia CCMP2878 TaxID=1169474 RepID=A0A0G4FF10_9ALVE|eukprot:Cvel_16606.t1-p1 / transcript=Cvel_16606.t1 / gene=Cvel_16606 / organism=Chromera_velia_CCMP2878 / gene_product=hypothetical protein / transcript_product=hypothetical protein / location=Cvel_scaffold1286:26563-31653(-) / protein_length=624 / sequence_SO=supercontig / SO=protein_coding / is_pseudo=false
MFAEVPTPTCCPAESQRNVRLELIVDDRGETHETDVSTSTGSQQRNRGAAAPHHQRRDRAMQGGRPHSGGGMHAHTSSANRDRECDLVDTCSITTGTCCLVPRIVRQECEEFESVEAALESFYEDVPLLPDLSGVFASSLRGRSGVTGQGGGAGGSSVSSAGCPPRFVPASQPQTKKTSQSSTPSSTFIPSRPPTITASGGTQMISGSSGSGSGGPQGGLSSSSSSGRSRSDFEIYKMFTEQDKCCRSAPISDPVTRSRLLTKYEAALRVEKEEKEAGEREAASASSNGYGNFAHQQHKIQQHQQQQRGMTKQIPPEVHFVAYSAYCEEGMRARARDALQRAEVQRRGFVPFLFMLARLSKDLGDLYHARALLETALSSAPDSMEVQTAMALLLKQMGDWQNAIAVAQKLLRVDSDYPPALFCISDCFFALGQFELARECLHRCIVRDRADPSNLNAINAVHAALGLPTFPPGSVYSLPVKPGPLSPQVFNPVVRQERGAQQQQQKQKHRHGGTVRALQPSSAANAENLSSASAGTTQLIGTSPSPSVPPVASVPPVQAVRSNSLQWHQQQQQPQQQQEEREVIPPSSWTNSFRVLSCTNPAASVSGCGGGFCGMPAGGMHRGV